MRHIIKVSFIAFLPISIFLLISCGGSSNQGAYVSGLIWLYGDSTPVETDLNLVTIKGEALNFLSANNCPNITSPEADSITQLSIMWSNESTGQNGQVWQELNKIWLGRDIFGIDYYECITRIEAEVPLEFGENVIAFDATKPSGADEPKYYYDHDEITYIRLGSGLNGPIVYEYIPLNGGATISWSPVAGATSYNLYWDENPGVSQNTDSMIFTNVQSPFTISGMENGHPYYFVMTALNNNGEGFDSSEYSFTPNSAPKNVYASAGDSLVSLSWDKYPVNYPFANNFVIYMATESGITKDNWGSLADGARFEFSNTPISQYFTIKGLQNYKTYYFVVTLDNGDESPESSETTAMPKPGATAPETLDATAVTDVSAVLNGVFQGPAGYNTDIWFEYGVDSNYGTLTSSAVYAATGTIPFSADIVGLTENTTYHFRLVSNNSTGIYTGGDKAFSTYITPQLLIEDLDAPVGLEFDGQYLYWMEIYGGKLMKLLVSNNQASMIATFTNSGNSGALTMDSSHIYWSDNNDIWRIGIDGTGKTKFASLSDISLLKIHSTGLYVKHDQSLSRISLDGQTTLSLYTRTPNASEGFGGKVELNNSDVFWADFYNGTIQKMPLDGGQITTLAVGLYHPNELIIDFNTLYFSDTFGIYKMSVNGGLIEKISDAGGYFTKDGTDIYVARETTIFRVDANAGNVETLVVGQRDLYFAPVTNNNNIYWLTSGNHYYPPMGLIQKISK